MKKLMTFIAFLLFPIHVLAYSNEVYLGGNTIGIEIKYDGVMVIGFYKVDGKYPKTDLVEGDIITKINDTNVGSINDLTNAIEDNMNALNEVNITYKRNNQEYTTTLTLNLVNDVYKTGLYVKDTLIGCGSLSFIDPATNQYGALGHEIVEVNTNKIIEVKTGSIFKNSITSISASRAGNPGSKNSKFYYNTLFGDITKNTKYGIYGTYNANYDKSNLIPVGKPEEIKVGPASIYTVLKDQKVEEFSINITNVNTKSDIKNITFEITDAKLLEKTGGIVQGMSGSPIVQNGKIIGAVTHVVTDNVTKGYGLFITKMLEESEK